MIDSSTSQGRVLAPRHVQPGDHPVRQLDLVVVDEGRRGRTSGSATARRRGGRCYVGVARCGHSRSLPGRSDSLDARDGIRKTSRAPVLVRTGRHRPARRPGPTSRAGPTSASAFTPKRSGGYRLSLAPTRQQPGSTTPASRHHGSARADTFPPVRQQTMTPPIRAQLTASSLTR
jgi:hypothetical protein